MRRKDHMVWMSAHRLLLRDMSIERASEIWDW
jgi:hypothetical protein